MEPEQQQFTDDLKDKTRHTLVLGIGSYLSPAHPWTVGHIYTLCGSLNKNCAIGSYFEYLLIREWYYLGRIRRHGFVRIGVTFSEEVCHWRWALSFKSQTHKAEVSGSL